MLLMTALYRADAKPIVGRLPTGTEPAGRRARSRPGTATAASSTPDPRPTTLRSPPCARRPSGRATHAGRQPAVDFGRTRRSRPVRRRPVRAARHPAAGRDRRCRAVSARRPWRSPPAAPCERVRWSVAGPAGDGDDDRRCRRHRDRGVERDRRRDRSRRTAPPRRHDAHPGQLRARRRLPPPISPSAFSTRLQGCGSCARARCRSTSMVRPSSSSAPLAARRRCPVVHPPGQRSARRSESR